MKKIIIALILFCFVGCQKEISVNEPAVRILAQVAISQYIDKNPSSADYILAANEIVQGMEYDATIRTLTVMGLKSKLSKKISLKEKKEILLLIDLVFLLANQQFKTDNLALVEPEYFKTIQLLFGLAAETAELYSNLEGE